VTKIDQNIIRQIFTLLLILFLGYLIFIVMMPFMTGVFGAITLYILMKRPMRKMVLKGWNPNLAASLLLIISFFGILIPIGLIGIMLYNRVQRVANKSSEIIKTIKEQIEVFENSIGVNFSGTLDSDKTADFISTALENLIGSTFNTTIAITIMYFLLFYMLVNRKQFIESMYTYLPLRQENIKIMGTEIDSIVKSNAIGIPIIAILQGVVALIGFLVLGVPNPWFWFVITTIGSMIPIIGTTVGIGPVVFLLFSAGQNWQAVAMIIYALLVVGMTDNFFRMVVQKRLADIHPLITLVGVIIGIPLFGFMGLIFGPLLISLFLLTLRIYKKEYVDHHHS
jgi:predicted PurR-regulated permease PerM